jgi:hypothetical protein
MASLQGSLLGGSGGGGSSGGGGGVGARSGSSRLKSLSQAVHPTMSAEDALTLSPWEKFRTHRRVPWKLMTHLIILSLCWAQTQQYTWQVVPYFLDSKDALHSAFFGFDTPDGRVQAERSPGSGLLVAGISEQSDFRSAVAGISFANLFFDSDSVDDYAPVQCAGHGSAAPPCAQTTTNPGVHVHINWNDPRTRTLPVATVPCGDVANCAFDIGQDPTACAAGKAQTSGGHSTGCLGTVFENFSSAEWQDFFQRIESMQLSWNLRDTDVRFLHLWSACRHSNCSIDWHMTADFTFTSAGKLQVVYSTASSLAYDNGTRLLTTRQSTPKQIDRGEEDAKV